MRRLAVPAALALAAAAVAAAILLSIRGAEGRRGAGTTDSVPHERPRAKARRGDAEDRRGSKGRRGEADRLRAAPPAFPPVRYRDSRALGAPGAGRLVRGTQLPARGAHFATWDPILRRSPSRGWRRHGTAEMVRTVLTVQARYATAEPGAPPMLVGDLSRPRGGDFGPQYGFIGHSTHQNGLDADVYYPRRDRRRKPPKTVAQVDRRLAQRLVDLFVAAGAEAVLVGPNVGLTGPPQVVKLYPNHDNHLHVRIRNPG